MGVEGDDVNLTWKESHFSQKKKCLLQAWLARVFLILDKTREEKDFDSIFFGNVRKNHHDVIWMPNTPKFQKSVYDFIIEKWEWRLIVSQERRGWLAR